MCGALEIGQLRLGLVALGPAQAEKSPGAQTHTQMHVYIYTRTHLPASKDKDVQAYSTIYTKEFKRKCRSNIYTQRNNGFIRLFSVNLSN